MARYKVSINFEKVVLDNKIETTWREWEFCDDSIVKAQTKAVKMLRSDEPRLRKVISVEVVKV